jgi:predicted phage terminase large subunit-like protein
VRHSAVELRREKLRRLARRDLATFARLIWPVLNPGVPLVWGWHLDAICEHLQAMTRGDLQRLVINVPPGTGKTSIVSVIWPTWEWLHQPESRFIGASYDIPLASRMNQDRRSVILSGRYQGLRPDWRLAVGLRRVTRFANDRRGWMMSTSTAAGITGEHADVGIIDDPIRPDQVWGPELKGHVDWFDSVFASRFRDQTTARVVVVMQRVHEADLTGHLLSGNSAMGRFDHLLLPMEYVPDRAVTTSIGWSDPRTTAGELLTPNRFGPDVLATKRRNKTVYATQYQQNPIAGEGNVFDKTWWRMWKKLPPAEEWVGALDCNFGQGEDPDFAVIQVWQRTGRNAYLVDQVRGRWGFAELVKQVEAFCKKHRRCLRWVVEMKANGPAVVDALKAKVRGFVGENPDGSKMARAAAAAPVIEGGHVYLPHSDSEAPDWWTGAWRPDLWIPGLLNELASFPRGANDDQVDTLSMALRQMQARLGDNATSASKVHKPAAGGRRSAHLAGRTR